MSFEFEHKGYTVSVEVDECRDAYGTGDSPTMYEVNFISIFDEDDNEVSEYDISHSFYDELEEAAISEYMG